MWRLPACVRIPSNMDITNSVLHRLARKDYKLRRCFLGVFPINRLPYIRRYPAALIVNTDTHNLPGQHWIAVYIDENKLGEVFDSFGRLPPTRLQRWMNVNCRRGWTYSANALQFPFSTNCGAFCLYCLLHCSRNYSLTRIVSHLSTSSFAKNDLTLKRFMKSVFSY